MPQAGTAIVCRVPPGAGLPRAAWQRWWLNSVVVVADGLRDAAGGADDLRDVSDGERVGDPHAAERVLQRARGLPERLVGGGGRRPDPAVPVPGDPGRRQQDAAQACGSRPDDVSAHLLRRRASTPGPLHLLQ